MKLYIENLPPKLNGSIKTFCEKYGVEYAPEGVNIRVQQSLNDNIGYRDTTVFYKKEADIFRLLVKWIHAYKNEAELSLTEKRQFDTFGIMLDFSRNEIMHVDGLKKYIMYAAGFGVDRILLYLEDTYEVKDYPYMGYFRGRYTAEELKEINDYAASFGIETVACIQTLGHMERFLRWYKELRDTRNVLLPDEEKTYEFIEKCVKVIAENIDSPYIHIGMDEAFNLGGGAYKTRFGDVDSGELFVKHMKRVCEICKKMGKQPVIWGDMLIALSSKSGSCFDEDVVIKKEMTEKLPSVEIVYWDYYSVSESHYEKLLDAYNECGKKVWFAGGIWTWETFTYSDKRTKQTTEAAIKACLKKGVRDVFATSWVNPGGFCPHIAGLYGAAVWSHQVFVSQCCNTDEEFEMVIGEKGENFTFLTNLDAPQIMPQQDLSRPDQQPSSAVTSFLFQSILCGLFDTITKNYDLAHYYKACADKIATIHSKEFKELFQYYAILAKTLSLKANLGNIIYRSYHEKDNEALRQAAETKIPDLIHCVQELILAHRTLWNRYNKPFGFDVVRNHYAGIIADCYDTRETIREYLCGMICAISQLEQPRLEYRHDFSQNETGFITDVSYDHVYTASRGG